MGGSLRAARVPWFPRAPSLVCAGCGRRCRSAGLVLWTEGGRRAVLCRPCFLDWAEGKGGVLCVSIPA